MDGFLLTYDGFDPAAEGLREALTSTGNGYLCTRGAAEWEDADGVHYPGTYVHGGYNRETTILGGLPVLNEDLVNLPNWLVLQLRIEGGDAIRLADVELLGYRHELDIRYATVVRDLRFRDRSGRETTLHSRRFVSMADAHHAGIEWTLVPENWSGRVEVVTAIDGRVSNGGVARYQQLEGRHLNPVSPRTLGPEVIALKAETRQSNLYISQAARTRVFRGDEQLPVERTLYQMEDYIQQVLAFDVHAGRGDAGREDGGVLHVARPGGQRHAGAGRPRRRPGTPTSPPRSSATPRHGTSCGGCATCACPETSGCSCCCGCTSRTSCRSAPVTPPTSTPGCPPAGSTARPIAGTCSGTRSMRSRSSTSGCPRSREGC